MSMMHYVQSALSQVKSGKAAGSSGILPEMLKISQINGDLILCLSYKTCECFGRRQACAARLVGCHSC